MILFEKVRWKNFLSTGNQYSEIDFQGSPTTLIVGANGSGKSTVLDALTFVLFGKPFRSVNKNQLVNSINQGGTEVEVEFTIGTKEYIIRRGIKKNFFEIYQNGKMLNQDASIRDYQEYLEKTILKLNYKSFTQIVILGSSNFVPFMQLNSAGRRECVEDFLDIKVFSTMSLMAKERLRGLKDTIREHAGDMSNLEYKLDLQQQRIRELEKNNDAAVKNLEDAIGASKEEGKEA